jgi:hypothetical protein
MALTKQVPVTVDTSAESRIMQAKDRIAKVTTAVTESRVRLDFLKKQYDELKVKAAAMGVADTKELPAIIEKTEQELVEMLQQMESALSQAEQVING